MLRLTLSWLVLSVVLSCSSSEDVPAASRITGQVTGPSGSPVAGLAIGIYPPAASSAVTAADGSYVLEGVPPGAYEVVPYVPAGSVTSSPPNRAIVVSGNQSGVDFTVSTVVPGPSVSIRGRVTYSGQRTGRVHIVLNYQEGNQSSPHGVTLPTPGEYEVRGVRPGRYVVQAFMDSTGSTSWSGLSPWFTSSGIDVGIQDVTLDLPLQEPEFEVLAAADRFFVNPVRNGVAIDYEGPRSQGREAADRYSLYWGRSPDIAQDSSKVIGSRNNIWAWPGGQPAVFVQYDLVDDDELYFFLRGHRDDEVGPATEVFGPVRVGEPTGRSCIRGVIRFAGGYVPEGPLVLSVESPRSFEPFHQVWATVESPSVEQPYEVCGVIDGSYMLIVRIDTNRDGIFWTDDPSEEFYDGIKAPFMVVDGQDVDYSVVFAPPRAHTFVNTRHVRSPAGERFEVVLDVRQINNIPVQVTLEDAPVISGPVDLNVQRYSERDGMIAHMEWSVGRYRPPETPYALRVAYLNELEEQLSVTPVTHNFFPKASSPVEEDASAPVVFSWSAPDPLPEFDYFYFITVYDSAGEVVWASTAIPPDATSTSYGFDRGGDDLVVGKTYTWRIAVRSAAGDRAEDESTFTVR